MPSDSTPVPRLPRRHAPRRRLTRLLDEAAAQAIVVNAPAGYGKTTLAAEWLQQRERVAWYSASAGSADVAAFSVGIADAVASVVPEAGARLRQRVRVAEALEELRPLAELLAEDLAEWPSDVWLVIDDYHLVMDSRPVEEFMDWLLALAPIRVLVTTRRRPAWATARRMLYGEIIEVGRDLLAMTSEEAGGVIEGRPSRAVEALVRQAEGWPALIGLAAISASLEAPRARVSEALFRYFAEEVLRREPPRVQDFMLVASVLPTLTVRAAHEVLGVAEPASLLGRLAEEGLVDTANRDSFRFHPLLRDFLRQKLAAERPELLERAVDAALADARGDARFEEAFTIAVEAGRADEIEAITADAAPSLLADGRLETVEKWLDACSGAALQRPALALAQAEALLHRDRAEVASGLALTVATRLPVDDPLGSRAWYVAGQASKLVFDDEGAVECLQKARRRARTDEDRVKALYGLVTLAARLELDAVDEYAAELETMVADRVDDRLRLALARYFSGRHKGSLAGLWKEFEPLVALADHASDPVATIHFFANAATLCISRAEYALALELAERAIASCGRFRLQHPLVACLTPRAFAEIGCGNVRRARETVAQIERTLNRRHEHALRSLAAATFRLKLAVAEGSSMPLEDELELMLDTRFVKAWLGEYRALVAVAAAAAGDVERSAAEAAEAWRVSRTIEVRYYLRFAEIIRHDLEGTPAADVRREAALALRDCTAADILDAFVTAYSAYPRLLELIEGDPLALATARRAVSAPASQLDDSPLTRREGEVLRLMSEGLSNAEIAQRLVISDGTAKVHVHHILEKLGAKSRLQAIVKAQELLGEPG